MIHHLTQTSRAALMVAALAVPTLAAPAMAQTEAPASDTSGQTEVGGSAAAAGAVVGGGGSSAASGSQDVDTTDEAAPAPDAGQTDDDQAAEETPAQGTITGSGQNTGSAEDSGGSVDPDQLTYGKIIGDLQSGRDFSDQLQDLDDDTTVTVMGLSQLQQSGTGSLSTTQAGNPPMTGGRTTNETTESVDPGADTSGGTAGAVPDAPAGMSDGAATGGGTQTAGMSVGRTDDIDAALAQADQTLTTLRASLSGHEAVAEALEDDGYAADDVIALHRDDDGLTVVVDDRDQ